MVDLDTAKPEYAVEIEITLDAAKSFSRIGINEWIPSRSQRVDSPSQKTGDQPKIVLAEIFQ